MHLKDKRSREKKSPCLEVFATQRSPCLSKNAGSRLLTHTSYFRFTSKSDIREHEHDVCFGSKADMCSAKRHVCFTPESDIKCDIWECPLWTAVQQAASLFDQLVGAQPE